MNYTKEDLLNILADSKNSAEIRFSKYLDALESVMPKRLYRYCEHNNSNIDLIINEQIRLANPTSFNDLHDSYALSSCRGALQQKYDVDRAICAILRNTDSKFVELRDKILQQGVLSSRIAYSKKADILNDALETLNLKYGTKLSLGVKNSYFFTGVPDENKQIGDVIPNSLVGCFSETNDDILMWAHYGKSFSGICFSYEKTALLNHIKNRDFFIVPVIYNEFPRTIGDVDKISNLGDMLWNLQQFAYKGKMWAYENEWRIVKFKSNICDKDKLIGLKGVSNVYLGNSFSFFNKWAFHFDDDNSLEQDSEESQLEHFLKLFEFAKEKNINIVPTRPLERVYRYEADESQCLLI